MKIRINQLQGEKPAARYGFCDTPVGRCLLADTERGICWLSFFDGSEKVAFEELERFWKAGKLILDVNHANTLVNSMFSEESSKNKSFDILLSGTPFQLKQWTTLTELKPGETITYAELAKRSGTPRAIRAVGTAIGRNPVAFLLPCHRVVRADGSPGGYRWGVEVKRKLLDRERAKRLFEI